MTFMIPRRRSRGVLVAALISACAVLILLGQAYARPAAVYAAPSEQATPMTHPAEGRENCLMCHDPKTGVKPAPADHAGRTSDSCLACHQPQPAAQSQPQQGEQAPVATPTRTANPTQAAEAAKVDPASASAACRTCHNTPEFSTVSDLSSGLPDTAKQLEADHSYAHREIACVTCHQGDPHQTMTPVTKESIADACGRCHITERQEHVQSVHGQSLAAGGKDAATCIDCHSTENTPHSIARVLSPDSPVYGGAIAATCAKCHAKTEVMQQYGIPTDVYKTYLTTFHGKANVLSPYEITQHPKATCINCHGYHDIKADSDPTSPVAPANLAKTCAGCHPGAGEQFAAGWLGHKEATPQQFPAVYFAERFFFFLTSSVLTFGFIFMVAMELGSWILRRKSGQH
jgi:hypothetical protein